MGISDLAIPPYVKLIAVGVAAAGVFYGGWSVRHWYDDSVILKENAAAQKVVDEFHKHETVVSGLLEDKLASLRANERIIEHETLKIIDRPVYNNVCLDDDGLRLIEAARVGQSPDTAKPVGEVPRTPEPAHRGDR